LKVRRIYMNKEFLKKMIKAETLRYQAIKEILPNSVKDKMDTLEKDAVKILKDIAYELISENIFEQDNSNQTTSDTVCKVDGKKSVKPVQVDFN